MGGGLKSGVASIRLVHNVLDANVGPDQRVVKETGFEYKCPIVGERGGLRRVEYS